MTIYILDNEILRHNINQLILIDEECFMWDAWTHSNFIKPLPLKDKISLIVFDENKIIGYLIGYKSNKNTLHISRLVIRKEYQNKDFGSILIDTFIQNTPKSIKNITLECTNLEKILNYYITKGFKLLNDNELEKYLINMDKVHKSCFYLENPIERCVLNYKI